MNKFKMIIFDLDGTLLNTIVDITNALNTALKELGFKEFQEIDVCYFVGQGVDVLIKKSMIAGNIEYSYFDLLKEKYLHYYSIMKQEKTQPYNKMIDVINVLRRNNYKTAVLSNKPENDTIKIIEHYFGNESFDLVYGAKKNIPLKPDPTSVIEIINKMGFIENEVLYIGDTSIDIQTAINANITSLGAGWGFRTKEELKNANAQVIIEQPLDILDYLGLLYIPKGLENYLENKNYLIDNIGCSKDNVFIFDDVVLKVSKNIKSIEKEIGICNWLHNKTKINVPKVIKVIEEDGRIYFLMSKINGNNLCSDYYLNNPLITIKILVKAIKELKKINICDCPYCETIEIKLDNAFYSKSFNSDLYEKLKKNKPSEVLTFVHGDFCLPNIIAIDGKFNGLIDLSDCGKGDFHQDLALCAKSIIYNFKDKKYANMFLKEFNLDFDDQIIQYYIQLDDLIMEE